MIDRLNAVLNDSLKDPALQKLLSALGLEIVGGTPDQFRAYLVHKNR